VDSPSEEPQLSIVHHESPGAAVTTITVPRVIEMYSVSERELAYIESASSGLALHLIFFGISFGASMAFLISLLTAELSNKQFALVWALFVLVLATIYFGVQAYRSSRIAGSGVRTIKNESKRLVDPRKLTPVTSGAAATDAITSHGMGDRHDIRRGRLQGG
jgi:hypothetical protein